MPSLARPRPVALALAGYLVLRLAAPAAAQDLEGPAVAATAPAPTSVPATDAAVVATALLSPPGLTTRACASVGFSRPVAAGAHAAYDAALAGRAHGGRAEAQVALTVNAGVDVWFDVARCPRAQQLALDLTATPRWTGPGLGASVDTAAALQFGPTVHEDPDLGVLAWSLTSWELGYQGALRAEPGLAERQDLARDLFDRFTVTGATRGFRIAIADQCRPGEQREECARGRGPLRPAPMTIDLIAVDGSTGFTEQGRRRDEQHGALALMRVAMTELDHVALDAEVDLLRVERDAVAIGDVTGRIDTVWPLYVRTTNPATGTRYVIGYGEVVDFSLGDGGREPVRDHRPLEGRAVGGFGFTTGGADHGTGAGWNRTAYVTMAAEPVLEDRVTAEAWRPLAGVGVGIRARAFGSRLERLVPASGQARVVWTGGAELGGSRRLGGLDADLTVEAGRSYYATLDGGAATPGFGARAQLTLHHVRRGMWTR